MTAALAADAAGLDTLVVEKSPQFGGSTALSGGGIWVPGAPSQRKAGLRSRPRRGVRATCKQITDGLVSDARLRQYVDAAPEMMEFLEKLSPLVRIRLEARLRRLLPGAARRLRARQHDQRARRSTCASSATRSRTCCTPLALAPKGIWFAPKDLRLFYQVRQNWRGKAVLVKLIWRMFRARVFGDRMAAIGQSLAARLRLAMKEHGHPAVAELADDRTDHRRRRHGDRCGGRTRRHAQRRIGARRGVILASGGFDHDMAVAPAAPARTREGLELRQSRGDGRRHPGGGEGRRRRPTCSTRPGGSRRCAGPTAGCSSCSTSG